MQFTMKVAENLFATDRPERIAGILKQSSYVIDGGSAS